MTQNLTTIEQSKKLIKLGLNPDSADFRYYEVRIGDNVDYFPIIKTHPLCIESDMPCWSVASLLDIMPKLIDINLVCLTPHNNGYSCTYGSYKGIFHAETSETAIESCFNMVVWLLETGYINPKDK